MSRRLRFGILGAAWANAAAYGLQAVVAYAFSQRFYPIVYERGRAQVKADLERANVGRVDYRR